MAHTLTANVADQQGHKRVVDMGAVPDDPGSNWAVIITRDAAGLVTDVRLTKDSITYKADFGRDADDLVTTISAWAVV